MGADIKALRTRIKSVDSTLHLTKAMGLVASSKIRRALDAMNKGREYEEAVSRVIQTLTLCPECEESPFMRKSSEGKTCLVVIAGDRGLAGGYNANVFRVLREYEDADIFAIGKRACERFSQPVCYAEQFGYQDALGLALDICRDFSDGTYQRVGIVCTRYLSMMSQEACVRWILPLARAEQKGTQSVIFEPDEMTVLNATVPEYVAGLLVSAVRESFASEVAARRCAMDSAGKNAQQMIDELQLKYNRARQGAITQEITEIVAGSGT